MRSIVARFVLIVAVVPSAACAADAPAEVAPAPRTPGRAAQVVNATILANGCQEFGPTDGKLAERAMYELVEGCTSVPGGVAQFGATLVPGGHIDITGLPVSRTSCRYASSSTPLCTGCRWQSPVAST